MRFKGVFILLIILMFIFNINCGGGGGSSSEKTTKVTVVTKLKNPIKQTTNLTVLSISTVRLTITGPGMKPITMTQVVTQGQQYVEFQVFVPNGKDRLFLVEMFDENGALKYKGEKLADLTGDPVTIEIELERIAVCNDVVEAGSDEPESIVVELGQNSGTFQFDYDTYFVKDRITIIYEGNIIYDSGCIGTEGIKTEFITYSGNSTKITIQVEPNCEGTVGTAWDFTVYCPNTTISSPIIGTWIYGELENKNKEWLTRTGKITFKQDGSGIDNFIINKSDIIENIIEYFTYTIKNNPDSSFEITFSYPDNTVKTNRFIISDNNKIMLMDGTNKNDTNSIKLLLRIEPNMSFTNRDLLGDYYVMGYEYNKLDDILWIRKYKLYKKYLKDIKVSQLLENIRTASWSGIRTFDGENTSDIYLTINTGELIMTKGFSDTYIINPDGFTIIRGDQLRGYLVDNKFGIFPSYTTLKDWIIVFLMMRGDREYSNADLEGVWAVAGFGDRFIQESETLNFFSSIGTLSCNTDANCILSMNKFENNNINYSERVFNFNVDTDGSFGTFNGTISPPYASVIGYNGNIIFMNLSFGQNEIFNKEILVGIKCNRCANIIGMAEKKKHSLSKLNK